MLPSPSLGVGAEVHKHKFIQGDSYRVAHAMGWMLELATWHSKDPPLTIPVQAPTLPGEPVTMQHKSRKQPGFTGHLWMPAPTALFLERQPIGTKQEGKMQTKMGTRSLPSLHRQQGTLEHNWGAGGKNSQPMGF